MLCPNAHSNVEMKSTDYGIHEVRERFPQEKSPASSCMVHTTLLTNASLISEVREARFTSRIREDSISGVKSAVNGTHTFCINGLRHHGNYDARSILGALE